MYYVAATAKTNATCKSCTDAGTLETSIAQGSGAAGAAIAVALLLCAIRRYGLSAQRKAQLMVTWRTFNLGVKAKVGHKRARSLCCAAPERLLFELTCRLLLCITSWQRRLAQCMVSSCPGR